MEHANPMRNRFHGNGIPRRKIDHQNRTIPQNTARVIIAVTASVRVSLLLPIQNAGYHPELELVHYPVAGCS